MRDGLDTPTGRFTGEQSRHLNWVICDMVGRGLSTRQISDQLRLSYHTVSNRIFKLRCAGVLEPFQSKDPHQAATNALRHSGSSVGSMKTMLRALGFETTRWIVENTPHGATAVEFIASIVRDAHYEETEETEGRK